MSRIIEMVENPPESPGDRKRRIKGEKDSKLREEQDAEREARQEKLKRFAKRKLLPICKKLAKGSKAESIFTEINKEFLDERGLIEKEDFTGLETRSLSHMTIGDDEVTTTWHVAYAQSFVQMHWDIPASPSFFNPHKGVCFVGIKVRVEDEARKTPHFRVYAEFFPAGKGKNSRFVSLYKENLEEEDVPAEAMGSIARAFNRVKDYDQGVLLR